MSNPFDVAKAINGKTGRIECAPSNYVPYMINRIFSNNPDSIAYANMANTFSSNMSQQQQFDFYYHGLPKAKRYGKWFKNQNDDDEKVIDAIKEYYGYSTQKAREVYVLFDDDLKRAVIDATFKGGMKK